VHSWVARIGGLKRAKHVFSFGVAPVANLFGRPD
jgi:hypothetical protein